MLQKSKVSGRIIDGWLRYYVHGVSYIDERLMMYSDSLSRPFYYVVDRMNNVRMLIDRAGAIVERYAYDAYGRPRIRESCGRGDMDDNTWMDGTDTARFTAAKNGSIWDPRADMDDDGDVDSADQTLYNAKYPTWSSLIITPTVAQAFSDVDNPFMFQGVPHFALDTQAADGEDKLSLNHHRARFEDCATGRWCTRDPLGYYVASIGPAPRGAVADDIILVLRAWNSHFVKTSGATGVSGWTVAPPDLLNSRFLIASNYHFGLGEIGSLYARPSPNRFHDPTGLLPQPSFPCTACGFSRNANGLGVTKPCKKSCKLGAKMCFDQFNCAATPGGTGYFWAPVGGGPTCGPCAIGTEEIEDPGSDQWVGSPPC